MYSLSLRCGGLIRSAELQRALANICNDATLPGHGPSCKTAETAFRHLCQIESLEARGMRYSNQDFDVLSSALNFIDAVAPAVSAALRNSARDALATVVVGPLNRAELCDHCGATCPNSWSNPRGYVQVNGKTYCDGKCHSRDQIPAMQDTFCTLEGVLYAE